MSLSLLGRVYQASSRGETRRDWTRRNIYALSSGLTSSFAAAEVAWFSRDFRVERLKDQDGPRPA